jgi:hypothetical protein
MLGNTTLLQPYTSTMCCCSPTQVPCAAAAPQRPAPQRHNSTDNTKTYPSDFLIPGDKALVQEFVRDCAVCQQNKTSHLRPSGLLQPLPVPSMIWSDLAMDFIEALPRVNNKTVILTVINRLSKAAHFIPLGHPYTATSVARHFLMRWCASMGFLPPLLVTETRYLQAIYGRSFFVCRVQNFTQVQHSIPRATDNLRQLTKLL